MEPLRCLVVLTAIVVSPFSHAVCPMQETTVFYVNGIDTKRSDADNSRKKLEGELHRHGFTADCVTFDLAYNSNEPLFLDFLEGGLQRAEEATGRVNAFWESYFRMTVPFSSFNDLVDLTYNLINEAIRDGKFVLGNQLDEHLGKYQPLLANGKQIVLVGHSQGNLYASEAWARFTPAERLGAHLVAVATPDDDVPDGGPWTTLHRDTLATTLFAAIGALPSNTPMTEECADTIVGVVPVPWLCHGFKEAYLLGTEPREKIVNDLIALLPTSSPAVITVDGDPSEWTDIPALITDPAGDDAAADIVSIKVANDENLVYFLLTFASPSAVPHIVLHLDTDLNPSTGCTTAGIGAEYGIVLGTTRLSFIGDARDCPFTSSDFPDALIRAASEGFIEVSVPISTLKILTPGLIAFDITVSEHDLTNIGRFTLVQ